MKQNDIIKYDIIYYRILQVNKTDDNFVDGVLVQCKTMQQWWSLAVISAGLRTKRMHILPGSQLLYSLVDAA